jgi:hypothetical protein
MANKTVCDPDCYACRAGPGDSCIACYDTGTVTMQVYADPDDGQGTPFPVACWRCEKGDEYDRVPD